MQYIGDGNYTLKWLGHGFLSANLNTCYSRQRVLSNREAMEVSKKKQQGIH